MEMGGCESKNKGAEVGNKGAEVGENILNDQQGLGLAMEWMGGDHD